MSDSEAAIDRQLASKPNDFLALVAKGDLRLAAGDDRAAVSFYRAALHAATPIGGPLPLSYKDGVERAQAAIAAAASRFEQHLERHLAARGFGAGNRPLRFQQSLDILTGRRHAQLQLQRPTTYYYPGLAERRFFERSEFEWASELERSAPLIADELNAWLTNSGRAGFAPYMVSNPDRPRSEYHGLIDNPAWSTLYIWEKGGPVAEFAPHFPATLAAMQKLPMPHIGVRAPSVLFSMLQSGAAIPPHHGMLNARLVCHLPLVVPAGCGFKVGGETRPWEPGKLLIFDDTVEHEAWNNGSSDRIILIFDVWRPELNASEREAITAMFEAIDSYSG